MKPVPILFLGDSPSLRTGLARIGRDLASCVAKLPEFRVGFLGRGGMNLPQLPFYQCPVPVTEQWCEQYIETAWAAFAGETPGVIMTIWDPSRLHWFANPTGIGGSLEQFLRSGRFRRWGYFPVDSYGIGERLTGISADTIGNYDRVLGYGAWGAGVLSNTIRQEVDWIPHGINLEVFTPRDKVAARMSLGFQPQDLVVGCVMTNQARKDWGLAFATISRLRTKYPNLVFWAHVDVINRHWDLRALASDFGMTAHTVVTDHSRFNDTELSYAYSACDITMLPSLGEGYGYPVVESLACGVPCITGHYGGAVELVPNDQWLVPSWAQRLESPYNCIRPVYDPVVWTGVMERAIDQLGEGTVAECTAAVEHLDWKLLWPSCWRKWFLSGLAAE